MSIKSKMSPVGLELLQQHDYLQKGDDGQPYEGLLEVVEHTPQWVTVVWQPGDATRYEVEFRHSDGLGVQMEERIDRSTREMTLGTTVTHEEFAECENWHTKRAMAILWNALFADHGADCDYLAHQQVPLSVAPPLAVAMVHRYEVSKAICEKMERFGHCAQAKAAHRRSLEGRA